MSLAFSIQSSTINSRNGSNSPMSAFYIMHNATEIGRMQLFNDEAERDRFTTPNAAVL
jgi:hypothetical protein